jgi:hypothetical protein
MITIETKLVIQRGGVEVQDVSLCDAKLRILFSHYMIPKKKLKYIPYVKS